MKTQTITLSVDEFTRLMSIDNKDSRAAAASEITRCACNPGEAPTESADPTVRSVCDRIAARRERARKAAERRKARKAEKAKQAEETKQAKDAKPEMRDFNVPMTDLNVRRLLWIKQNYEVWVIRVTGALKAIEGWKLGADTAEIVRTMTESLDLLLKPLTKLASRFMLMPRHERPASLTIPLPVA